MTDETRRLVDAYGHASEQWGYRDSGPRQETARDEARAALDAHLSKLEAVADVAGDHQCTSSCKDIDGPCAILEALRALVPR